MSGIGPNAKCRPGPKCLLFGVDRTYGGHHEIDASDPKRTTARFGLGSSRRRSTELFKIEQLIRKVADKVRGSYTDNSLQWTGEDPDGRGMGIVPKGANHAFQRRGETSKVWLVAASALTPLFLCLSEPALAQCAGPARAVWRAGGGSAAFGYRDHQWRYL